MVSSSLCCRLCFSHEILIVFCQSSCAQGQQQHQQATCATPTYLAPQLFSGGTPWFSAFFIWRKRSQLIQATAANSLRLEVYMQYGLLTVPAVQCLLRLIVGTYTYMQTWARMWTLTWTFMHTQTHIWICFHTWTHMWECAHMNTCDYSCAHTHKHACEYTHMHIHAFFKKRERD